MPSIKSMLMTFVSVAVSLAVINRVPAVKKLTG